MRISGKDAFATGLTGVQSWVINENRTQNVHSHSGCGGGSDVHKGNIDLTGQIVCFSQELTTMFPTGSDVSGVQFTIDNTVATGKDSRTGTIRVESVTYSWNSASPDPVTATVTFGVQGDVTDAETGAAQASEASAPSALGLAVEVDGVDISDLTDGICVQAASLTFTRPVDRKPCGGFFYSTSGNLAATLSLTVLDDDSGRSLWNQDTPVPVRITVDGYDTAWEIQDFRWANIDGPTVAVNDPAALQYTVNDNWVGVGGTIEGPSTTAYIS